MICKNCNQEILDTETLCPNCGAEVEQILPEEAIAEEVTAEEIAVEEVAVEEVATQDAAAEEIAEEEHSDEEEPVQEEKPKLNVWKLLAFILGGIVLVGVLVLAVLHGLGIDLKPKANDIYAKGAYSVTAEEAAEKKDVVVATIGNKKLNNSELQLYYDNAVTSFYYENYYYMSYIGLDPSLPLSEQACMMEEGISWEQYFLENALTNWQSYTLVEILAEQDGYDVGPELRASIDSLPTEIENHALESGSESLEAYMAENMGVNVNMDDEIQTYYTENADALAENNITEDMGLLSDVRHILVSVEGGTENEDGTVTYSEEDWNTALAEAERILQEWKDGEATEESFAQLAASYTDDTASAPSGGLYTDLSIEASYVEPFLDWATDSTRRPGDTGIVQTEYGYHIMYFVEGEDYSDFLVAEEIIAQQIRMMILSAKDANPMEVDYKKISLVATDIQ